MVKKFNYSDIIKNEIHKYIGYKSKEPINKKLAVCILSVLSKNVSKFGVFTQFTHKDLFNQLWQVLSHSKLFGREEKKEAELVCRIEMYKLENQEIIQFNYTGKSNHYTIQTTLKGNRFLHRLYENESSLFKIGDKFSSISTRRFKMNNNEIMEINLESEKGILNNSFDHDETFKLMKKTQQDYVDEIYQKIKHED